MSSSSSSNNNNNDYSIAKVSEIAAVSHKLLVALWGRSKHENEVILIPRLWYKYRRFYTG